MTMIQIQSQVSLETLLNSLKQLTETELEQVATQAAVLRAKQKAPNLSNEEESLLLKINQGVVPQSTLVRCASLSAKSRQGTISQVEYDELMELIDQIEFLNAERISFLTTLAQLRQISLDELMEVLEIRPLAYE